MKLFGALCICISLYFVFVIVDSYIFNYVSDDELNQRRQVCEQEYFSDLMKQKATELYNQEVSKCQNMTGTGSISCIKSIDRRAILIDSRKNVNYIRENYYVEPDHCKKFDRQPFKRMGQFLLFGFLGLWFMGVFDREKKGMVS